MTVMAWLSRRVCSGYRAPAIHSKDDSMPVVTLLAHAACSPAWPAPPYPFAVGETLQYDAKLGMLPIGSATMTVNPMTRERGREAFVFAASRPGTARSGVRVGAELTSYVGTQRVQLAPVSPPADPGRQRGGGAVPDRPATRAGIARSASPTIGPRRGIRSTSSPSSIISAPCRSRWASTYQIARYFKTGYNPVQVRVVEPGRPRQLPHGGSAAGAAASRSRRARSP